MKSQHAVSTNKTLTFCGAKNILGEKKTESQKKYPKKTQLTLYTKTYKDYVKT
jgi:hypothetical protein